MTSTAVGERTKRVGSLWFVAASGLLFTIVFLGELTTTDGQPLVQLASAYSLLFSGSLVASSEWLRRESFTGDELLQIVGALLVVTLPISVATWLILLDRTTLGTLATLGDIAHVAVIGAMGGLVIGVVLVRQRQTTDQLRDTRSRLESVLNASPLPIISVDTDGEIETWNPAAEHTFGWPADEVLGEPLETKSTTNEFDRLIARFRNGELVDGLEEQRQTRTGEPIDIRTYFAPIYDGDELSGGMAIVQDITEENQRKEELVRSRQLRTWTERIASVGGWEWEVGSDSVRWTEGTRRIHEVGDDYDPDLTSAIEFYHADDRETIERLVEQTVETGEPYDAELRLVTANGKERWVEVRGERVETEDYPTCVRGAIRDISERREHEQRLMVLNRVLRHNLRNGLTVIQGHAELLHDDLTNLDLPRELQESSDSSEFIDRLSGVAAMSDELNVEISRFVDEMERLREFSVERAQNDAQAIVQTSGDLEALGEKARQFDQLISDADSVATELVSVRPLLVGIADRYRSEFPSASITVMCEEGIQVAGSPIQIEAAVEELVENAIVHTEDSSPQVEISVTRREGQRIDICVADWGPGLPQTELETLHQGEETPLMHGKGVGLWLVTWATSRMDGSLTVAENEPTGARVTMTLPSLGDEPPTQREATEQH